MTHSFDTDIAQELGIEAAVILQNFAFWIIKNLTNEKNIHDGKAWTYNSYGALEKLFPYIKKEKIKRVIIALEKEGILVSRTDLNKNGFDKTKWYSLSDHPIAKKLLGEYLNSDAQSMGENSTTDGANLHDGECNPASSLKNNNQRQIKNTDKKPDSKKSRKFSFSLSQSTQFENISKEYREKLKGYAVTKDGAKSFDEFLDFHIAKGSKFKDWSRAYNTWLNNSKKFNNYNPSNFVETIYDEQKGVTLYAEYGSSRLYTQEYDYVADRKMRVEPQVEQEQSYTQNNAGLINSMMENLADVARV